MDLGCASWEQRSAGTRRERASPPNPLEHAGACVSTPWALASSTVHGTWQLTPHVAGCCEPPETVGVECEASGPVPPHQPTAQGRLLTQDAGSPAQTGVESASDSAGRLPAPNGQSSPDWDMAPTES